MWNYVLSMSHSQNYEFIFYDSIYRQKNELRAKVGTRNPKLVVVILITWLPVMVISVIWSHSTCTY